MHSDIVATLRYKLIVESRLCVLIGREVSMTGTGSNHLAYRLFDPAIGVGNIWQHLARQFLGFRPGWGGEA